MRLPQRRVELGSFAAPGCAGSPYCLNAAALAALLLRMSGSRRAVLMLISCCVSSLFLVPLLFNGFRAMVVDTFRFVAYLLG